MRKDRFGRYLPIMTAVTAMALYPATSRAQSMSEHAKSAVSDTAEKGETPVAGASPGTAAELLSQIHETDQADTRQANAATRAS